MFLRGERWISDFVYDGVRYKKSWGPVSKSVAKEKDRKFRVEIAESDHVRKLKKILFENFAVKYLENAKLHKKPKSVTRNEVSIKMLKEHFEGKLLTNINPFMVEQYKKARKEKGVNVATINRDLATLRNMLNKAVDWGYLFNNPIRQVKQFREDNEKMWVLSPEEEAGLLAACERSPQHVKYLGELVRFALNTGMRLNEIFSLRKADVDQEGQFLTMPASNSKTGKGRVVPMNGIVMEIVKKRMDYPGEYVFTNKRGAKLTVLTNAFWNAVKGAGLTRIEARGDTCKEERFRFHDLRHTFGSRLGMAGTDLKTIMEIMGHKTTRVALRYQHPTQDHKLDAVKTLEKSPQFSHQGKDRKLKIVAISKS